MRLATDGVRREALEERPPRPLRLDRRDGALADARELQAQEPGPRLRRLLDDGAVVLLVPAQLQAQLLGPEELAHLEHFFWRVLRRPTRGFFARACRLVAAGATRRDVGVFCRSLWACAVCETRGSTEALGSAWSRFVRAEEAAI